MTKEEVKHPAFPCRSLTLFAALAASSLDDLKRQGKFSVSIFPTFSEVPFFQLHLFSPSSCYVAYEEFHLDTPVAFVLERDSSVVVRDETIFSHLQNGEALKIMKEMGYDSAQNTHPTHAGSSTNLSYASFSAPAFFAQRYYCQLYLLSPHSHLCFLLPSVYFNGWPGWPENRGSFPR